MIDDRGNTPALLALAVRVVGIAGRLVPTALRGDWEREWHAELWHLYHSLEARGGGPLPAREQAAFVLRSVGSVFDALQLRLGDAQLWSASLAAVASRWGQRAGSVATALLFLSLGIAADALLIAIGHFTLEAPASTPLWILGVAVICGVSMIVTSAAAAAHLLGPADPSRDHHKRVWVVETLLVAGVTGLLGRWFAAFGMRDAISPSIDLGAAVTSAWVVSWVCGLTVLTVLRLRRRNRSAALPG